LGYGSSVDCRSVATEEKGKNLTDEEKAMSVESHNYTRAQSDGEWLAPHDVHATGREEEQSWGLTFVYTRRNRTKFFLPSQRRVFSSPSLPTDA